MDDKTLVETAVEDQIFWDTAKGEPMFTFEPISEELYNEQGMNLVPIAFPRTLKAARQILKEAGWTIVRSQ